MSDWSSDVCSSDLLALRVRRLLLNVLQQRHRYVGRERHVVLAGDERQHPGRTAGDDPVRYVVEVRQLRLPVVLVLLQDDGLVLPVFGEFERPRADSTEERRGGKECVMTLRI